MASRPFEWVCKNEPPTRPAAKPRDRPGRPVPVTFTAAKPRDRNALGFQRDLPTSAAYGVDEFLCHHPPPTRG